MITLPVAKSAITADGTWKWCEIHMVRTMHKRINGELVCDECNTRSNADTPVTYNAVSVLSSQQPGEAA